jgi:hypothetical protein
MKRSALCLVALVGVAAVGQACQGGFPTIGLGHRLVVNVTSNNTGSPEQQLPISISQPTAFTVDIQAELPDGTVDTSFNGVVNLLVQPGTISDPTISNVQLQNGSITGVIVPVVGSFGETHIWADDLGFEPVAPDSNPPPQCSDGIDNNNNGLIDYPADPGCYAPVDNTENLGTYASGASQTIFFQLPRISLVRGYDPATGGEGNATAFPNTQVAIDTGWQGGTNYTFSTVVIGLTSAGFYVQDLENDLSPAPGYGGLYAYNFDTPTDMRVCDRIQVLSGTSSDFYGFTELNYPTWQLEYWNPAVRPCLVPEATVLGVSDINSLDRLWQLEATLGRVETAGTVSVAVAAHFGPGNVPLVNGTYTPDANDSNCDFSHDGKVNFEDPAEAACAAVCDGSSSLAPTDYQCSEYSSYASQNDFILVVQDSSNGSQARIQANASAAVSFNPVQSRGQQIHALTGMISYFSGGEQFTLNVRCDDDVIASMANPPLTSNVACVNPRTSAQINANTQQ